MKTEFNIFYSWQSDLPNKTNRGYIKDQLLKDIRKIEKELSVKINVDEDTRGSTDNDVIEKTIISKISQCDFFIGDISPIIRLDEKEIPNPNVLFEMGYATSTIGNERVIRIWNSEYGNVSKAPFDFSHYKITEYNTKSEGSKQLSLYNILKDKIENYEKIVSNQLIPLERQYDVNQYKKITSIIPENEFYDGVVNFINSCRYTGYDSDQWDNIIKYYNSPSSRFKDEELHYLFSQVVKSLVDILNVCIKYCDEISRPSYDIFGLSADAMKEFEKSVIYKIRDPYLILKSSEEALKEQIHVYDLMRQYGNEFDSSYRLFRHTIQLKLNI